ncbi:hypothetical protein B0H34DRAFT_676191 [Crassisporium funariophilum]|nr:hypothetical protein B0H34DRAFT_676191 [Crassisporium funariophilum]
MGFGVLVLSEDVRLSGVKIYHCVIAVMTAQGSRPLAPSAVMTARLLPSVQSFSRQPIGDHDSNSCCHDRLLAVFGANSRGEGRFLLFDPIKEPRMLSDPIKEPRMLSLVSPTVKAPILDQRRRRHHRIGRQL